MHRRLLGRVVSARPHEIGTCRTLYWADGGMGYEALRVRGSRMPQERTVQRPASTSRRPVGVRRVAYWCGRVLEGVGLLLIWWVLLLFAGTVDMGTLLFWSLAAVLVFSLGWGCTVWAKKGR